MSHPDLSTNCKDEDSTFVPAGRSDYSISIYTHTYLLLDIYYSDLCNSWQNNIKNINTVTNIEYNVKYYTNISYVSCFRSVVLDPDNNGQKTLHHLTVFPLVTSVKNP